MTGIRNLAMAAPLFARCVYLFNACCLAVRMVSEVPMFLESPRSICTLCRPRASACWRLPSVSGPGRVDPEQDAQAELKLDVGAG